jgi:UDPglucose 6-dehydrogenase
VRLCVIGTGYVGLVAGTCFAESGNDVICVDNDAAKVEQLKRGAVPIYEPGLEELIRRNVAQGRLVFQTDLADAVRRSVLCFIAVGTPESVSGEADLSAVLSVAEAIGDAMDGYRVIVDKSTVPVGTAARVEKLVGARTKHEFDVVSNPEFLKEGAAVDDFQKPDRVVIGSRSERATVLMRELYKPFVRTGHAILIMNPESAEMTKYAANAMLATRISLINEIANICEAVGSDVEDVRRGVGLDRRVGPAFLFPGAGYGGSCFPKDVKALIRVAEQSKVTPHILNAVDHVNDAQKNVLFAKINKHFGGNLKGRCMAVWGLSFKPRTDDMREAPAVTLIDALLKANVRVQAHDPEALEQARKIYGDKISYHRVNYEALNGADALVIVTEWEEFRAPDFERMRKLLKQPVVFDGRNLYDLDTMRTFGFTYYPIGRQPVTAA